MVVNPLEIEMGKLYRLLRFKRAKMRQNPVEYNLIGDGLVSNALSVMLRTGALNYLQVIQE